ncbi:MAG: hypothetical protein HPY71_02195 [Firmicutes bacterium]|nr:hypothetical protein [Bacillota bacterium]
MNVRGILTILGTWFLRASILAFILLVLSQGALTFEAARVFLCRVERFEGRPALRGAPPDPGWITPRGSHK